ncbi:MAG: telomerase inhibitor [Thelocarpon superellum]|nr:MAG: telomerase inhibitor [Thelocarpon superellum]
MGLAGPRKRTKISQDPNNVNWARSTDTFGHKILTAQGWKPGGLLGLTDAPHAEHHSAASQTYIRVALKDDNLGLGAKVGRGHAERAATGLSAFESILDRLSGKSGEEIERKQEARAEVTRRSYIEQRFGTMTFVRGGMLVGNKIQELKDAEEARLRELARNGGEARPATETSTSTEDASPETTTTMKQQKKKKRTKKTKESDRGEQPTKTPAEDPKRGNKSKKRKQDDPETRVERPLAVDKAARKQRKLERRTRREARRVRKEQTRAGGAVLKA